MHDIFLASLISRLDRDSRQGRKALLGGGHVADNLCIVARSSAIPGGNESFSNIAQLVSPAPPPPPPAPLAVGSESNSKISPAAFCVASNTM